MSYHNLPSNAIQSLTNTQGQTAPDGYHYMPDGTLMSDIEHARLYGEIGVDENGDRKTQILKLVEGKKTITSFNLDTQDIKEAGETRKLTITGDNGAMFSLEIKNEDNYYYNFQTNLFQAAKTRLSDISITNGFYTNNIVFPLVTDADQYDIYLWADPTTTKHAEYNEVRFGDGSLDINSSTGSSSNLLQKVIYQTLDVTVTLRSFSPNNTVTGTIGTQTFTASRDKGVSKLPFSFTFTATSTRTLSINRQPTANDIMAFVAPTIGSAPVDIPGEDIYPTATTAFTGDDINGAITSGTNVRMDATDISTFIKPGDKITTPTTTGTVNGSIADGTVVEIDEVAATLMAVGDKVTSGGGGACVGCDVAEILVTVVATGGDANKFTVNEATEWTDGGSLTFSSKVNRSVTTVGPAFPVTETDFTMSQAIQFRDNAPLTFYNRRNYRWPISNMDGLQSGMRVSGGTASGFSGIVTIKEYLEEITLFEGEINEEKITKKRVAPFDKLGAKPTITRNASTKVVTTVQTGNIVFSEQALLAFAGESPKIFSYGPSEIKRLTGYDVEFSDLAVALTEVTTTTTASTVGASSTSVVVANRAGIMDGISSVSGVGINPAVANPTVSSGAGSVTGAGTIVLSAAQEVENGVTLTFPGAGTIATITGYVKVKKVGNEDVSLRFDLEKFLTMH